MLSPEAKWFRVHNVKNRTLPRSRIWTARITPRDARAGLLVLVCGALIAAIVTCSASRDIVIYNRTPSIAVGLYVRADPGLRHGAIITIRARDVAPRYSQMRGARSSFRLLKRVAATAGDVVCAHANEITINGVARAWRRPYDSAGRVLPTWDGCHILSADQIFVLGDSKDSFDGRYFGVMSASVVEGFWRPLMTF